ncbi:MAG: glycosyltransferase [Proteobacteria bacterium]|nr:MAG: glycosyltransferase [Pseudomonadota bacterium]
MERADILRAPYRSAVSARGGRRDIARWMSPLKVFEYMAANRPMVASDLPVLREVLVHDRNAILAPPDDVQSWIDAFEALRRDGERARRIAAAARDDFERFYTWKARAEHVVGALDCARGVSTPANARS